MSLYRSEPCLRGTVELITVALGADTMGSGATLSCTGGNSRSHPRKCTGIGASHITAEK
jgi:hypothetical protein